MRAPLLVVVAAAALGLATVATACGGSSDPSAEEAGDAGSLSPVAPGIPLTDAATAIPVGPPEDATAPGSPPTDAGASDGVASDSGPADGGTIAPVSLTACPTTSAGAFSATGASCFAFTPVDTGEPKAGENATRPHYALRQTRATGSAAPKTLLLFFIGSGGHPSDALVASSSTNVYAAAVADGDAVLALSYANEESIGDLCGIHDDCYFPTRESIILGENEANAALEATPDESIVDRTARALRYLAAGDPGGGWASFLASTDPDADPATTIDWTKIIVAGHSQGGGHAAAMGKLFLVDRVVQLSSTCDSVGATPASWTNGSVGTWATAPSTFLGFAAPTTKEADGGLIGDTTCPAHAADWANLGMAAANRVDDASTCGNDGTTSSTHGASLGCTANYPVWLTLFAP